MANFNKQTPAQALAGGQNFQKRQLLGALANLHNVREAIPGLELEPTDSLHKDFSSVLESLDKFITDYHLACKQATISRE